MTPKPRQLAFAASVRILDHARQLLCRFVSHRGFHRFLLRLGKIGVGVRNHEQVEVRDALDLRLRARGTLEVRVHDDRDRALFPKLRSYMIRTDDMLTCPTCRRRFEVPSHQSLVFLADGQLPVTFDPDDDNFGNR